MYESGAATNYITRTRAIKKLQLTLKDFRRLCILKGVYPHEPLHKKIVNKGSTENRIYYYVKDINFLASEPIVNKFREYKIFLKKLTKAKARRERDRVKALYERRPQYQLDNIVKERYPTFSSALRDLDDTLCMCFAFAVLPHTKIITTSLVESCRKLTAEFNHYIIESQSLSKVFVSIKGIYYQAEVNGERITWIVGHDRGVGHVTEVDFSVMATFVEFYVSMLGFVNYRLYQSLGLYYPPKISYVNTQVLTESEESDEEKILSLASPLAKELQNEEIIADLDVIENSENSIAEKLKEIEKRKTLFKGCKFWLNRETPKDLLTIVIRSCGGLVCWDNCPGGSYKESDDAITHQIVDRSLVKQEYESRYYVQPQWVIDSFNVRCHLPMDKYFPGSVLPPHLSPFADVPYESLLQNNSSSDTSNNVPKISKKEKKQTVMRKDGNCEAKVEVAGTFKENKQKLLNEKGHDLKLREMMIPKKHKKVYSKIKRGIKRSEREKEVLRSKREKLKRAH